MGPADSAIRVRLEMGSVHEAIRRARVFADDLRIERKRPVESGSGTLVWIKGTSDLFR
ncbi:MAG: hypothetical protein ACYCRH_00075 [Acidiferrobacteraceae bacterium]